MNRIAAMRNRQPTALPAGLTVTDRLTGRQVQLEPGLKAETYHHRRYRGWSIAKSRRARWHKARTNAPWQPGWLSGRISEDQRRARGALVGEPCDEEHSAESTGGPRSGSSGATAG